MPQTSSTQPLQALLLLPAASAGPCWPRVGLSRARSCSRWPLEAQLVAQSASAGPAPASTRPLQLPDFLRTASPGPAPPACHWPLEAQPSLLPPEGLHRPCLCLTADSPRPALASLRPPNARAPPAFRYLRRALFPPPNGLVTPSTFVSGNGLSRPSLCLLAASPDPVLPQAGLSRPSCGLPASRPGPAPCVCGCGRRPISGLTTTSLVSAPAQLPLRGLCRPQTS
nr:putative uncharacterized protein FLJ46235 [Chlorocebus sabaeus]